MIELKLLPFPILLTERLVLRRLSALDSHEILALRSDERVNRFLDRARQSNLGEASEFIAQINSGIDSGKWIYWAITRKGDIKLIGTICLWNFSFEYAIAEIGYELLPPHQGKGYMKEAIPCIVNYAFKILKLKRIEAYTHRGNVASCKLLERNNFLVEPEIIDVNHPDNVIYALVNHQLAR